VADELLRAGKHEEASAIAQSLLAGPEIDALEEAERYRAVWITALSAAKRKDFLQAHELFVVLTDTGMADAAAWVRRADSAANLENWDDAMYALTVLAKNRTDNFGGRNYDDWLTRTVLNESAHDPALKLKRVKYMEALFDSGYTQQFGGQPSAIWRELAAAELELGDLEKARSVARRITSGRELVRIIVDKRFDALVAAEPSLRDVLGATTREKERLSAVVAANPRRLDVLALHLMPTLYELGEFKAILNTCNSVIQNVERSKKEPAYDDVDTHLAWIHEMRATALSALGKPEKGLKTRGKWLEAGEHAKSRTSLAINQASHLVRQGRPKEALQTIEGIDWSKGLTTYGRTQLQHVRLIAFLQLGQKEEADSVLAWFREHRLESPATAQSAFVQAGDLEAASEMLRMLIENPATRSEALVSVQGFMVPPGQRAGMTANEQIWVENYATLLAREEVRETIDRFGRRMAFPIYDIGN